MGVKEKIIIDFSKIKREDENKWVALSKDHSKILHISEKLIDLKKKVGNQDVVYMKIPVSGSFYAF